MENKKTIQQIKEERASDERQKRINKLRDAVLEACRTGEYSISEVRMALGEVKSLLDYIPLN